LLLALSALQVLVARRPRQQTVMPGLAHELAWSLSVPSFCRKRLDIPVLRSKASKIHRPGRTKV
jgi:hypothetical protein